MTTFDIIVILTNVSFHEDDNEKLEALGDINSYIEEMEKMYQKAS